MLLQEEWNRFYEHKKGDLRQTELDLLSEFIENRSYIPIVREMQNAKPLSPPEKKLISKTGSQKKRVIYTYPFAENTVLKMLAWLLRDYDGIFSKNLYSFRTDSNIIRAVKRFAAICDQTPKYSFKLDISNYYNSVPVDGMIAALNKYLDDVGLLAFFEAHLRSSKVICNGEIIDEKQKGIMAGTPISPFLANLYLADIDEIFINDLYARYADDIIIFADTEEERRIKADILMQSIADKGLDINPSKMAESTPEEGWTFLGISYFKGTIDISDASKKKCKDKLRRKARSLIRWKRRKKATDEQAAKAFIRAVNRKFFDNPKNSELTWTRWYYPAVTTDESLKELDHYIQDCIRYVMCEKHNKKAYSFRYERMKEYGYRSLVHEYYDNKEEKQRNTFQ